MDLNKSFDSIINDAASNCLCFNLRCITRTITRDYDKALAPAGLKTTQFSLLSAIYLHKSVTIGDLAKQQVLERTTLTRNLAVLEKNAFIKQTPGKDARQTLVSLTNKGQEALIKAAPVWTVIQAKTQKELEALDCLKTINKKINH